MDYGLDALRQNLTNPQRGYMWTLEIPAPVGLGTSDLFRLRVKKFEEPDRFFDNIDINFMGTGGLRFPGRERYSHEVKMTIYEGEDALTYQAIQSWMALIRDNISGVGIGDPDLMTDGILTLLSTAGRAVKVINILGMYPQAKGILPLTWDESNEAVYEPTFVFQQITTGSTS